MKKYSLAITLFIASSLLFFYSCTKINEATTLGGDLIPPVDNVNTFEIALETETNNLLMNDSVRVGYSDLVALGDVNDPAFGQTHANLSFTITPSTIGVNPFTHKDSLLAIDSVVLSLSYRGAWGDTFGNGLQTLRVYEIAQNSGFRDDTVYRYADPASDFTNATTGAELGSKTFLIKNLKDTFRVDRPRDTTRITNVVRIKLDTAIGRRFAQYDTSSSTTTGGYHSDATGGGIFRDLFKGLAIKADNSGNALAYFSLSDISKTKLIVYFRKKASLGRIDTTAFEFQHLSNGRANYVNHTPGNSWGAALNNGDPTDDELFIQSSPSGSFASILIPALDTFSNKVIHRAEIIAPILPSAQDLVYTPPSRLFIDRSNKAPKDTAFLLYQDIQVSLDGSIDFSVFGGEKKADNTYRFNISRYVQGIITRNEPNDTLRLYAPYRTTIFAPNIGSAGTPIEVPILSRIADGRVVLGGGSNPDPSKRLRLRIIYSNL